MVGKYSLGLIWSPKDGAYVATSPEFPGLVGQSSQPEAALRKLRDAIDDAVRTLESEGQQPPPPRTLQDHSGQLRVRLPKSLHSVAATQAEEEGISLNAFIQDAVSRSVGSVSASRDVERRLEGLLGEIRTELDRDPVATKPEAPPDNLLIIRPRTPAEGAQGSFSATSSAAPFPAPGPVSYPPPILTVSTSAPAAPLTLVRPGPTVAPVPCAPAQPSAPAPSHAAPRVPEAPVRVRRR